jgi:phage baseplate assembly protein W
MATTRVLSKEDGDLNSISIVTSRNKEFLDIDLLFAAKPNGELFKKRDAAAVKQAVKNLIQTNFYEKPFLPFFGANIRDLLFELAYDDVGEDIRQTVITAIRTYEPRARVLDVTARALPDNNSLEVTIEFQVINTQEIVRFTTTIARLR